ncbi:hypothetical protein LTR85_011169 [Meristemomyces frigidus]|nr:hypothetical protein LTR85_011169 [Meristemomyces frigidus]
MDAEIFAKLMADGGDTGTTAPADHVPAKQDAASSASKDPFADLSKNLSASSASPPSQGKTPWSAQGTDDSFGSPMQDMPFGQSRRCGSALPTGGGFPCPTLGSGMPGVPGMPSFGGTAMGGATGDRLEQLIQKLTNLMQQAGNEMGILPFVTMAKTQSMLRQYDMMPFPKGRMRLEKSIKKLERELGRGGAGMGAGFSGMGAGFSGMGGGFPATGAGFPAMGGGFQAMGGGFPGI